MSRQPVSGVRRWVPGPTLRHGLPVLLGGICLYLVWLRCAAVSLADLRIAIADLPGMAWVTALLATLGSFWAVGRYDVVLHRHLRTGQDPQEAAHAGRAAIAIGQTIGFGLITGALVRWKWFEPRMSLLRAGQLTLTVTVLFLACWGIVTLCALAISPVLPGAPGLWGAAAALALIALLGVSLFQPGIRRLPLRWPSIRAMLRLLSLTAVDTLLAAIALWVLLPEGAGIGFVALLPVYLLALGAALLSGTPGGVGPFEVTLLALLPASAEVDLLAACITFRLVYYALPASLAGVALIWRHATPLAPERFQFGPCPGQHAAAQIPHAEVQLHSQIDKTLLWVPETQTGWMVAPTPQALVALFDPLCARARPEAALDALEAEAHRDGTVPVLYKCDGRLASAARARGYTVRALAEDAVIDPARFDLNARGCRQLRRKLRKVAQSDLVFAEVQGAPPYGEMAALSADWAARNGGERGFSMSRFEDAPLSAQRIFTARRAGTLLAFVTFNTTRKGWALDLVRSAAEVPDGTTHRLVLAAIETARAEGCERFSLAAVPLNAPPKAPTELLARWASGLLKRANAPGLRQFKSAFAPRWETRYVAAPSVAGLTLAMFDVVRRIRPGAAVRCARDAAAPDVPAPVGLARN
ncbi:phosphatidylglycerol lysyltransferase domain-containing protein [Dinoroseobacter sp. S375]|uniref:phosphatidylglycerol lysyltransferase domain-containing protein n=1 Tax=Dinoroseobacter sp. S375 TaxID=3415136 RepID=UPI003C7E6475